MVVSLLIMNTQISRSVGGSMSYVKDLRLVQKKDGGFTNISLVFTYVCDVQV